MFDSSIEELKLTDASSVSSIGVLNVHSGLALALASWVS